MSAIKNITFIAEKISFLSAKNVNQLKSEVNLSDAEIDEAKRLETGAPGVRGVMVQRFKDGKVKCEPFYNLKFACIAHSGCQQFIWTKD
jgi:hypothetical protein